MKKTVLLSLAAISFLFTSLVSNAQTVPFNLPLVDSAMFYYRPSSILLFDTYKTNAASLSALDRMVTANRPAIMSGAAHFEIMSYMPSSEVGNNSAINTASLQASVVRSYLKTQYAIPHTRCTFSIDTTQNLSNVVQLQLVSGAIAPYSNTQINYSENRSSWAVNKSVNSYTDGVPYTSYLMLLARRYDYFDAAGGDLYSLRDKKWQEQDWDNFADSTSLSTLASAVGVNLYIKTAQGVFTPATQSDIDGGINILYSKQEDGNYIFATSSTILAAAKNPNNNYSSSIYSEGQTQGMVRTEPYAKGKGESGAGYREYPVFGVKTNALYWLVALPNIELEFFFGKSFSLNLEGSYTWLSEYLPVENAYYVWGVSAEFRYWFNRNKRFEHWYMGIYGQAGQYDFKFSDIGHQGDYYGAGLSFGYVLPITKHFNIEFGLAGGYIQYMDASYVWNASKHRNEWLDPTAQTQTKWGIFPTKAKVSLLWKF